MPNQSPLALTSFAVALLLVGCGSNKTLNQYLCCNKPTLQVKRSYLQQ
jgi:uncharacterized lipoprotein YmbA